MPRRETAVAVVLTGWRLSSAREFGRVRRRPAGQWDESVRDVGRQLPEGQRFRPRESVRQQMVGRRHTAPAQAAPIARMPLSGYAAAVGGMNAPEQHVMLRSAAGYLDSAATYY